MIKNTARFRRIKNKVSFILIIYFPRAISFLMEEISARIRAKAEKLLQEGKVKKELETAKRIHFSVVGTDENHSVIFDKTKNEFTCDCKYSSLYKRPCSHIVSVQILLQK